MLAHAQVQRLEPFQQHPGIERAERGAGVLEVRLQHVCVQRPVAQDRAAEAAALPVDVLGRGVHHQIGAELERPLQDRRREHVVDDHPGAGPMRQLGDGGDVDQLERRIARGFEQDEARRRRQRRRPLVEIGAVDQRHLDPEAGQDLAQDVAAGAEQQARCDHAIAGAQLAHQRGVHRGHAGGGGGRLLGALEQRQALLEHPHRGIGDTRVRVARRPIGEAVGGILGPQIAKARGQEQRLGCLAEPRAPAAAVDHLGAGAARICPLPCLQKQIAPASARARTTRPFSSFFNVACKPAGPNHHVRAP